MKNRAALKSFIRCMHILIRKNIAHTTKLDKLVDLVVVVACDGEDVKYFLKNAGKNATYTSCTTVIELVEAH